jgi:hypothetical protein
LSAGFTATADALAEADAIHARIHLDGEHLVYDLRQVVGEADAITPSNPARTAATASGWAGPGAASRLSTVTRSTTAG